MTSANRHRKSDYNSFHGEQWADFESFEVNARRDAASSALKEIVREIRWTILAFSSFLFLFFRVPLFPFSSFFSPSCFVSQRRSFIDSAGNNTKDDPEVE